jgi:glutamate N-acetyltransferase / amino-acid N-acetyltransferase
LKASSKGNQKSGSLDLLAPQSTTPRGFRAASVRCGLKKSGNDLAVIVSDQPAVSAAVFTRNLVQAAPVLLSREHLRNKTHRAILVNSGGANACTGEPGLEDAKRSALVLARFLGCDEREILVASTGVIGVRLDIRKIESGISEAAPSLDSQGFSAVAEAIMTTDTRPKRAFKEVRLGGKKVMISGIAKGSGMIHPNMATLLSFILTDAVIAKSALQSALKYAVDRSFNRVSVDGDTSTNDMLLAMANGAAENRRISSASGAEFMRFQDALTEVAEALAVQVARDGEGARKLITIEVKRAPTLRDSQRIAETIATSPLVKTAIAGADANWGRILAAAGRSGAQFDPAQVEIRIGNLVVARKGQGLLFSEEHAAEILERDEVRIVVDLHQGKAETKQWTCDLTEEYIRINADYRS